MDAKTVANYIVYIASDAVDDLTNMKINHLLYYAQGYYLNKFGKPLFEDEIEAWQQGPVIPAVYRSYERYGNNPIRDYDLDKISQVPQEAEDILYGIAKKYGKYTASALQNKTKAVGSSLYQAYKPNTFGTGISLSVIRDFFSTADDLSHETKQFKVDDFVGHRDEDGFLVLPKEWED